MSMKLFIPAALEAADPFAWRLLHSYMDEMDQEDVNDMLEAAGLPRVLAHEYMDEIRKVGGDAPKPHTQSQYSLECCQGGSLYLEEWRKPVKHLAPRTKPRPKSYIADRDGKPMRKTVGYTKPDPRRIPAPDAEMRRVASAVSRG